MRFPLFQKRWEGKRSAVDFLVVIPEPHRWILFYLLRQRVDSIGKEEKAPHAAGVGRNGRKVK